MATLGALFLAGYSFFIFSLGPCDKPLEYAIGRFDSQFGVSQEEFKAEIAEAESVWEKALGKDVFLYDPDAKFKINLIYDERQLTTIQKQKTEFGLTAAENVLGNLDAKFNTMKNNYDRQKTLHEQAIASFESRRAGYESKVSYWNARGGASADVYDALQTESRLLNTEAARLNTEATVLNAVASELNTLLGQRNVAATEYNKVVENYNQKYGHSLEFNQAEYTGKEINVYQFGNEKDLLLALTHELGHALGMNHVESAESIMYYLTSGDMGNKINPSSDDLAELRRVCKME